MLVLSSVLAGCSGGSGTKSEATASTSAATDGEPSTTVVDDDTGAIRGLVQSDELLPIPLATARLVGEDRSAVTNVTGIFVFDELSPGTFEVEVTAGDNEPVRQEIGVEAGAVADVVFTVTLEQPVANVPYNVTAVYTGYIECDFNAAPCPGVPEAGDKQRFNHTWEGTPVAFLFEVVWERPFPGVAPPDGFNEDGQPSWVHRLQTRIDIRSVGLTRYAINSPPYARASFNASGLQAEFAQDKNPVELFTYSAPSGFLYQPGYAYQTRFDVYATTFYVDDQPTNTLCFAPPEKCPTGFTPA